MWRGERNSGIIFSMPTVKKIGPHRFYFFSKEDNADLFLEKWYEHLKYD